jgi:hypothetical protein
MQRKPEGLAGKKSTMAESVGSILGRHRSETSKINV